MQFGAFKRGRGDVCPQCGAALEPGDLFCINCGAKVSGGGAAGTPAAGMPGQAGSMPPASPSSGNHTVLVGGPAPVVGPAANIGARPNAGVAAGAAPSAAPAVGAGLLVCPVCGQPVSEDADFCVSCGSRLSAPPAKTDPVSPTVSDPYKTAAAQVYQGPAQPAGATGPNHTVIASSPVMQGSGGGTCPQCNAPINPGDLFCVSCGRSLTQQPSAPQQTPERPAAAKTPVPQPPKAAQPKTPAHFAQGAYDGVSPDSASATPQIKEEAPITSRAQLVLLTREEARVGCSKTIEIDGQAYRVDIPAGVTSDTVLDLPGIGYFDTETGTRGSVRLSFFID